MRATTRTTSFRRLLTAALGVAASAGCGDGGTPSESRNRPPQVSVASPAEGAAFVEGVLVAFRGSASDPEDGTIADRLTWSSDRDGALGTGAEITTSLSVGAHQVTASVMDSDGASATASVSVTVAPDGPPLVTILGPTDGTSVPDRVPLTFHATAQDDVDGDLSGDVQWSSSVDGVLAVGDSVFMRLSQGMHTIRARVSDGAGATGSDSIQVEMTGTAPGTVFLWVNTNPSSTGFGRVEIVDSMQFLIQGQRDPSGLPDRVTDILVGDRDLTPESQALVSFDDSGRPSRIADVQNGALEFDYLVPDTIRVTWTPLSADTSYQVLIPAGGASTVHPRPPLSARRPQQQELPDKGTVEVVCGSGGITEPVPDATLNVLSSIPIPGVTPGRSFHLLESQRVGPGTFEYSIPGLGDRLPPPDAEARFADLVGEICAPSLPDAVAEALRGQPNAVRVLSRLNLVCAPIAAWAAWEYFVDWQNRDDIDITAIAYAPGRPTKWQEWQVSTSDWRDPRHTIDLGAEACRQIDVTGSWIGTIRLDGFGLFRYAVEVDQSGGGVTGIGRIATSGNPWAFRERSLAGNVAATAFTFDESAVVSENPPQGVDWCPIEAATLAHLILPEAEVLRGDVDAGACGTGVVQLRRVSGFRPTVAIISHASEGIEINAGEPLTLQAEAHTEEGSDLTGAIRWFQVGSDEPVASGGTTTLQLPVGTHEIEARVMDYLGNLHADRIEVVVGIAEAPTVIIVEPDDGATLDTLAPIHFEGTTSDAKDGDLDDAIQWASNLDGPLGSGRTVSRTLSVGTHVITASVTDSDGLEAADTITIHVVAEGAPRLRPDPGIVQFTTDPGVDPASATVDLTTSGSNEATGLQLTTTYGRGQPQGWLTATPSSDGTPTQLTLDAAAGSLPPGSYDALVTISGDGFPSVDVLVTLTITDPGDTTGTPNPTSGNVGSSYNDPHLRTLDSRWYDFMGVGDYVLLASTDPGDDLEVHVRYAPRGQRVSLNEAVAARVAGDVVNVYPAVGSLDVVINGEVVSQTRSLERLLPGGGLVTVRGGRAFITWPDGTRVQFWRNGVKAIVSHARAGAVEGLLGNYDGDPSDDVRVRNGAVLDSNLTGLYDVFRDSWRVPLGSPASLFSRGPDLFDPAFPRDRTRFVDLDPAEVAAAREICRNAGVRHPRVLDTCAYDIVVTGEPEWAQVSVEFDPSIPSLTVSPELAYLSPGATASFFVVPEGLSDKAVNWTATGGTVTSTGINAMIYTAPSTPGPYTITAISRSDASVQASATVVVEGDDPGTGQLSNGERHTGTIANGQPETWTFDAAGGEYVVLSMADVASVGGFTPWIQVTAPDGSLVAENWASNVAQVTIAGAQAGPYSVRVATRDPGEDGTGDYALHLLKAPGGFAVPAGDEGGPASNGENHGGSLDLGDVDLWTFDAAVGQSFVVSLTEVGASTTLTPWIRIVSPDGTLLLEGWNSTVAQVTARAAVAGTYSVFVGTRDSARDGTGDYILRLARAPGTFTVPGGDEGGAMENGANEAGTIEVGDLDLWTFDASVGQTVIVSMGEDAGGSGFTPWIRVFGPDGALALENWNSTVAQVTQRIATAGRYTVVVGTRDAGFDGEGPYRLRLVQAPASFTVPAGDEGGALSNGDDHAGSLEVGDLDVWTFDATAGQTAVLSLSETAGTPDPTPWIRVISPGGELIVEAWNSTVAQATIAIAEAGTHTVVVGTRDPGFDATGDYVLRLAAVPGSFTVPAGDDGGPITLPAGSAGDITLGDLDLWTFSAPAGSTVSVSITDTGAVSGFTPWVRWYTPSGDLLGEAWASDATTLDRVTPTAGTYTLLIGTRDPGRDGTGSYLVTVSGDGVTSAAPGG